MQIYTKIAHMSLLLKPNAHRLLNPEKTSVLVYSPNTGVL